MKSKYFQSVLPVAIFLLAIVGIGSCTSDLDVQPINPKVSMTWDQAKVFNKIYAGFVLTGQTGPDGKKDIQDIDEGTSDFSRQIWNANELTSDEAQCTWPDGGISEFNHNTWSDSHPMMKGLYYRLYFSVTLCNFFLQQTAGASDQATLQQRAEVRFVRAMQYYYLMDLFGNVPFTTVVSNEKPVQYSRAQVFNFVESELKACEPDMAAPRTNTYGRVDKAANWLLQARLYLNAQVYTGTAKWDSAAVYAQKVMNSGYTLCTEGKNGYSAYQLLFMGDNNTNGAQNEDIFPLLFDGETTQSYGGMQFLIASTRNGEEGNNGTSEHWAGNWCRKNMLDKFFPSADAPQATTAEIVAAAGDDRALFYGVGRQLSMKKETDPGFSCCKFTNVHSDGTQTHNYKFVDTDYPFMRLAEAYLTYAEALIRINNGECPAEAKAAINALRARAHATQANTYSLSDVLTEWSKEFWFEGRRRMDLVRFGLYGGQSNYLWENMGGTYAGTQIGAYRNIFPLPSSDLNANSNLKQNPEY